MLFIASQITGKSWHLSSQEIDQVFIKNKKNCRLFKNPTCSFSPTSQIIWNQTCGLKFPPLNSISYETRFSLLQFLQLILSSTCRATLPLGTGVYLLLNKCNVFFSPKLRQQRLSMCFWTIIILRWSNVQEAGVTGAIASVMPGVNEKFRDKGGSIGIYT